MKSSVGTIHRKADRNKGTGMGKHPGELTVGSYEHCYSWRDRESMFARPGESLGKLSCRSSVSLWAREPRHTRPTALSFPGLPAPSFHWPTSTGSQRSKPFVMQQRRSDSRDSASRKVGWVWRTIPYVVSSLLCASFYLLVRAAKGSH